jgi:hypothetical protein
MGVGAVSVSAPQLPSARAWTLRSCHHVRSLSNRCAVDVMRCDDRRTASPSADDPSSVARRAAKTGSTTSRSTQGDERAGRAGRAEPTAPCPHRGSRARADGAE